jgi:hypothetical protein
MTARGVTSVVGLVPVAELAGHLDVTGLALDDDANPGPACILVDLDEPVPGPAELAGRLATATPVLVGVARQPLSAGARAVARELACTLVPVGDDADPCLVAVADPLGAAHRLRAAAEYSPRAAMSLARLLRVTCVVPVPDALAAESAVYSMLLASGEFARWLAGRRPCRPGREAGPAVRVTRRGDTLEVVLNRPGRHNAFDRFVRDGLAGALEVAIADPSIQRVDLRGDGPSFCSGGDLAEFGSSSDVGTAHLIRLDRSVAARADRCRDRIVAHLHGACIGAGIEIPSFAGRVVAREDARFGLPELSMGLIPGAGGTVGITRRIGRWRTAYLALSGEQLDVSTARGWGLVDAVDST